MAHSSSISSVCSSTYSCGNIIYSVLLRHVVEGELKLKWPNDVLIDGKKVCGTLIEMEGDYFLVGIGCNVMSIPEIAKVGDDAGRSAACLRDHSPAIQELWNAPSEEKKEETCVADKASSEGSSLEVSPSLLYSQFGRKEIHKKIILELVTEFQEWLENPFLSNQKIIEDFERNMDFSPQRRRDIMEEGKNVVIPLKLNSDGTLLVILFLTFCNSCLTVMMLF
jgi:hypothetical protein